MTPVHMARHVGPLDNIVETHSARSTPPAATRIAEEVLTR